MKSSATLSGFIALSLCVATTACDGQTNRDGGVRMDGGVTDAAGCVPCAAPPEGCEYQGPSCTTCGTLVCDDGGATACGESFPVFDRRCVPGGCARALHQVDCCGNQRAIGIATYESTRFEAAEAMCNALLPACECPVGPIAVEDGSSTSDLAEIIALCVSGQCTTQRLEPGR